MRSRARRTLARVGIAVLALVVPLAVAQPAAACSYGLPDGTTIDESNRRDYRRADAAIVGRLIEVRPVGSPGAEAGPADFRYRVERVYKGGRRLQRARVVTVRSELGSTCGLPSRIDRRYGLLLHRRSGRPPWGASTIDAMSPRELRRRAAGP